MQVFANSPSAGFIAWQDLRIQILGTEYVITNGNTNARFAWWIYGATQLTVGNTLPTNLTDLDLVVFLNKSGTPIRVPLTSVIEGDLIVDGSILARHIGANQITADHLQSMSIAVDDFIQSTGYSASGANGWRIEGDGTAEFNNVIVRGISMANVGAFDNVIITGGVLRSQNYSAGSAGWRIDGAGNAELNSVTVRGTIHASSGSFSGTITSSATISGGTLSGTTFTGGSINIGSGAFTVDSAGNVVAAGGRTRIRATVAEVALSDDGVNFPGTGWFKSVGVNETRTSADLRVYGTSYFADGRIRIRPTVSEIAFSDNGTTFPVGLYKPVGTDELRTDTSFRTLQYLYADNGNIRLGEIWGMSGLYRPTGEVYTSAERHTFVPADNSGPFVWIRPAACEIALGGNGGSTVGVYKATDSGELRTDNSFSMWSMGGRGNNGHYGGIVVGRSGWPLGGNNISWAWDGTFRNYVDVTNVKNFIIDHPTPAKSESHHLIHTTLEGPENAVFYRGRGQLVDGACWVKLPDYFEDLVAVEGRSVLVTPIIKDIDMPTPERVAAANFLGRQIPGIKNNEMPHRPFGVPYLATTEVVDGYFIVVEGGGFVGPDTEFFWEVKGVRKDVPELFVEPRRDEVVVHGEGPYTYYSMASPGQPGL